jgi:hypothetical protein
MSSTSNVSLRPPLLIMLITTARFGFLVEAVFVDCRVLSRCGIRGGRLSTRKGEVTMESLKEMGNWFMACRIDVRGDSLL